MIFRINTVDVKALCGESLAFDVEWKIINDEKS